MGVADDVGGVHSLPFALKGQGQLSLSFPVKKALLFSGDFLLLNLALFLALTARQLALPSFDAVIRHFAAFTLFHATWLLIFYSVGLYDTERLAAPGTLGRNLIQGIGVSGLVTVVLLYVLFDKLQPKTVLALDLAFAAGLMRAQSAVKRSQHNGH